MGCTAHCTGAIYCYNSGKAEEVSYFWWWANLLIWKLTCNDVLFAFCCDHCLPMLNSACTLLFHLVRCLLTSTCMRRIYPTNTRGHGVYVEWGQKNLTLENFSTQDRVEWKMRWKDTLAWGCFSLGILHYTFYSSSLTLSFIARQAKGST